MSKMTYDEAEKAMIAAGISYADMQHDCDEHDPACTCDAEQHAPGDTRCTNRHLHTPCSHDRALADSFGLSL
jgi:hypothetical protein